MGNLKNKVSRQGSLTFYVTPDRIYIRTPLQAFFLEPKAHYWRKRMDTIRIMIELGEIRNLNELSEWCGRGIEWHSTTYWRGYEDSIRR